MGLEKARADLIEQLGHEISDQRALGAIAQIPRDLFVPDDLHYAAWDNRPLSIGYGQTISQPYIVALMTQALDLRDSDTVLEIGTGSGYQTAVLASLSKHVVTIERIPQLLSVARNVLERLGYRNISYHQAGKKLGWQEDAPYDAIIVTAAAPAIPDELLAQLVEGGRLIIPVGSRWEQDLIKVIRHKERNEIQSLCGCRFVPLIGENAWQEE